MKYSSSGANEDKMRNEIETLNQDIQLINAIDDLDDIGKGRAFLRQSLRSKLLLQYLQILTLETDIIKLNSNCVFFFRMYKIDKYGRSISCYEDYSILAHDNSRKTLLGQIEEQNHLFEQANFELLLNDPRLNNRDIIVIDEYNIPQFHEHCPMKHEHAIAMQRAQQLQDGLDDVGPQMHSHRNVSHKTIATQAQMGANQDLSVPKETNDNDHDNTHDNDHDNDNDNDNGDDNDESDSNNNNNNEQENVQPIKKVKKKIIKKVKKKKEKNIETNQEKEKDKVKKKKKDENNPHLQKERIEEKIDFPNDVATSAGDQGNKANQHLASYV
ncbi:hypothetical protein RFI_11678 [Reticulomyxa filosa]|uniref:Uncharacterized protein n=1 Tax=Reticulomyxa filosa TaxID=46433 RepID=X6NHT5_RETFI|nr:hypothetical protein RFI_11678 [Reticulomyxa filosa]|eukprot:ETO25458.1 hypothetical protein RFI_11678 [Reticulomyxa filosa]